ncbi:MAG: amidohydrolase [Thermodesulfobacteriota bacterium]|nr:amidohydrolase [Thermodesulfobacteriota bacterium]
MNDRLPSKDADLLIYGDTILTMVPGKEIIHNGTIAVKDDLIVYIGDDNPHKVPFNAKEEIKADGGLVMPGMVNAHTHASMVCFRGMADDLPLMEWLNKYIFPAESKADGDLVFHGALLACNEMILSGTTTFCDMYLFEDEVAKAAKRAGMRAVVGEVLFDFPSPNVKSHKEGLEYTEWLINKWKGDPLITPAVEPHAVYTCSPDFLLATKELSCKYNVPLITHLSESEGEVKEVKDKYGKSPVHLLKSIGFLGENLIADHCVCLTDDEMDALKEFGVKVAHNPESNMKLASGTAPIPELMSRGVPVGLGTDGCASNNNLDMFQEMDTTAKLHKVMRADPTVMNAKEVVEMATIGSAKVLGLDDTIGTLEEGKKADIIIIDMNKPHLTPLYNVYSHLVYTVNGADVETVIINGTLVMKDRKVLTIDQDDAMKNVREIAGKFKQNMRGNNE